MYFYYETVKKVHKKVIKIFYHFTTCTLPVYGNQMNRASLKRNPQNIISFLKILLHRLLRTIFLESKPLTDSKGALGTCAPSGSIFFHFHLQFFFLGGGDIDQNNRLAVADLRGAQGTRAPPSGPKFLHFHAVFGENWPNNRLAPPLELAPPPLGNPGSATG